MFTLWTIFFNPADVPDRWVVRRFDAGEPTQVAYICDSLDEARSHVPDGTVMITRSQKDHPSVIETWL